MGTKNSTLVVHSQEDLLITANTLGGGTITLKDFRDGDFGIRLLEARTAPQTTNTINAVDYQDNQTIFDTTGNDLILGYARGNFIDASFGGNDWIQPGDGRDFVYALSTNPSEIKLIEGGPGNDVVFGEKGFDVLFGGAGNDVLVGNNHPDNLPSAEHGDDYLDGQDGDDELTG
jgi:Ca2+-binding RTX toxin-like protein